MALYQMCSVLDMVAQQYGRPFFAVSEGSAIRGFSDEVNRPSESVISQHPNDFQLFHVGTFDDESCVISLNSAPRLMISGAQIKVNQPGDLQA